MKRNSYGGTQSFFSVKDVTKQSDPKPFRGSLRSYKAKSNSLAGKNDMDEPSNENENNRARVHHNQMGTGHNYFHHFFSANGDGEAGVKNGRLLVPNTQNPSNRLLQPQRRISSGYHTVSIEQNVKPKSTPFGVPYHISIGTIMAVVMCSSLVLSSVIMVAYKKIMKIYTNRNSYGTLQEES